MFKDVGINTKTVVPLFAFSLLVLYLKKNKFKTQLNLHECPQFYY